tara:strand:+ start:932 stop:1222 length:291 start_codon:yes stop_codon:yes gene_type:complete
MKNSLILILTLLTISCSKYYEGDLHWNYLPKDKYCLCKWTAYGNISGIEYSYEIEAILVKFSNTLKGMTQQEYCEQELKGEIIKCSHLKSNVKNNG